MIIAVLLFLLVYTIYTSSIPLPDVVNHVDDHITVGFHRLKQIILADYPDQQFS